MIFFFKLSVYFYKELKNKENIRVDGIGKAVYCCAGDSHSAVINEAGEVKYFISHNPVLYIVNLKILNQGLDLGNVQRR